MDSLNLKSLVEVARTGSFSKAAENLFVTQSAISRRIKCIEEQYGHPLLDRSGGTIMPTTAGKVVIGEAEKILGIEENLLRRLDALQEPPSLGFACTHPFGIAHLPDVLKRYMTKYSDLSNFRISFETPYKALDGLKEGSFDFIVIEHWEQVDLSGYRSWPMPEDEMIFVSAPKVGLSGPSPTIDELVKRRLFRRKEECCSWKFLNLSMQMAGRDVSEFTDTVTYDDLHLIIRSVVDGDGIALLSRDLVQPLIAEGVLCGHRVEGFNHRRKRSLILSRGTTPNQAMACFVSCLFSYFGEEIPALGTSDSRASYSSSAA